MPNACAAVVDIILQEMPMHQPSRSARSPAHRKKKDNKRRVCCLIFSERIQSLRLSISSQLAFDRIEQARETANFAARTFSWNNALGSGFVQFRHRVLQRLGKTFGIACHGFAEIANGMFNFGTTSTIALGAHGGLTNAFHG